MLMMILDAPLSRQAGLARLAAETARLGRHYAEHRNADRGPDQQPSTSGLSRYLRRRLVLEAEAVAAAQQAHGPAAEKFIQEVFWRSYFKGHLEARPWLWTGYRQLVAEGQARLAEQSGLRLAYERATTGRTGIECFDDWAGELTRQNWLHNHTRMWFASIWVFTLGLPWALGADFFMRHLIDGDPASNTLSWRWVAGLHTRGKPYAARAENIRRYTDGRYDPTGLNEQPQPLEEPQGRAATAVPAADPAPTGEVALLLHLDDLHPESLDLGQARVVRVCSLLAHADGAAGPVRAADSAAMDDALARASAHFRCPIGGETAGYTLVTAWAPAGPSAEALPAATRVRRAWDDAVWPHCIKGYFQVKDRIPSVLRSLASQ